MSLVALSLLLAAAQDQPKATFTLKETYFAFDYPKSWKYVKKGFQHTFEIPIPDSDKKANLVVMALKNSNTKDDWQVVQADAVKADPTREMVRQWEESIMDVPLMMTRTKVQKGSDNEQTRDTGMIYAQLMDKFVFHLTAPVAVFETAEYQWREALQTIRSTSGLKPSIFDDKKPPITGNITTWAAKQKAPPEHPAKGEMSSPAKAGGADYLLRYPKGWTASPIEGGFEFKHSDVEGPVKVLVQSAVDSPPVARALLQASSASLNRFAKVDKRYEVPIDYNKAGVLMTFIYRVGNTAEGGLSTVDGAGGLSNEYWLLSWSGKKTAGRSVDRLRELMQILRVEAAAN